MRADFEQDDWLGCLSATGFASGERTLFLWEGVTMYLNREAVEDSLRKIASTAPGSVVAFDYFTTEALESRALYWSYGRAATKSTGEPLKFGVDSTPPSRERLAELLRSCGLSLADQRILGDDTPRRADVTRQARHALGELILDYQRRYPRALHVRPHSAFTSTECPGRELRAWIDRRGWR